MSEILTHTRVMFDPVHPDPALIDIRDISHALSMLCRANGHFPTFYSVGQHCINCAAEAAARAGVGLVKTWDAPEGEIAVLRETEEL